MNFTRRTVFDSTLLRIHEVRTQADTAAPGDLDTTAVDQLVLPVAGVFARHDGPMQCVVANPNHALFFRAGQPYRISYPGCIGDVVLVFDFSPAVLAQAMGETVAADGLRAPWITTDGLLPPAALLARSLLWRRLLSAAPAALAIEEAALGLLAEALKAVCTDSRREARARRADTARRRRQQVDIVREAISVSPEYEWTLDALARLAFTTPCHLSRLFSHEVGMSIHQYLLRARLAKGLEAVAATGADLTTVALDAGFASHSHFTASFRALFGLTPTQWRAASSKLAIA